VEPIFAGRGAGSRALLRRAQPAANNMSAREHAKQPSMMRARPVKMRLRSTKTILLDLVLLISALLRDARCPSAPLPHGSFFS
jgi:hypothetical protein